MKLEPSVATGCVDGGTWYGMGMVWYGHTHGMGIVCTLSFSSCMLFSPLHPLTNAQYPHLCRGPADLAIDGQRSQPQ